MAIEHTPKPGQFTKLKSIEEYRRPLVVAGAILLAFLFAGGLLTGLVLSDWYRGRWLAMWMGMGTLLVTWLLVRWVLRRFDVMMNQAAVRRVALLKGGQAEAFVSMIFRDALSDDWHLFDNLKLDATSDIDHVLVGPGGIFVISTKSHRGLFCCDPVGGLPTHNGEPSDWARDAQRQAMRLRDQLAVVETVAQPWVQPVLALPFCFVDCEDSDGSWPGVGKVWVLSEDLLLRAIAPEGGRHKLSKAEVKRWAAAVKSLHERHASNTSLRA